MSRPPIARDELEAVTDLGVFLDLVIRTDADDDDVTMRPRKPRRPRLAWSEGARALVVFTGVTPSRPQQLEQPTAAENRAAAVWEKWTDDGRDATTVRRLATLPAHDGEWLRMGDAVEIGYRSDKFTNGNRQHDYQHEFGRGVGVHYFHGQTFGILVVRGGRLRVTKDGIRG